MKPEVLVCGAGPVALVAALSLAEQGIATTVAGMAPIPKAALNKVTASNASNKSVATKVITTTALAYSSVKLLERLGISQSHLESQPIDSVRVIDGNSSASFSRWEVPKNAPFGYITDNIKLWQTLYGKVQQHELIECALGEKVEDISIGTSIGSEEVKVSFGTTQRKARVLLAADGRNSTIRKLADFALIEKDYRQQAIQAVIAHKMPHRATAFECFLPQGPLALLPLKNQYQSALVWTLPASREIWNDSAKQQLEPILQRELKAQVEPLLGECHIITKAIARPLNLKHCVSPVKGNIALVGDAACAIHPIAGQGFNLALRGVAILTSSLAKAKQLGLCVSYGLEGYADTYGAQMVQMAAATHWLNRIFGVNFAPFNKSRGLGLKMVDKIGFIKRAFIHKAMGSAMGAELNG